MKLKNLLKHQGYTRLKLSKNAVGHFMTKIVYKKQELNAIIDSGASNTVFEKAWTEAQGYKIKLIETQGGGVGSSEVDIYSAQNKSKFAIGSSKIRPKLLYSMDFTHINTALKTNNIDEIQCIIGADYLNEYHAIIDYKKEQLFLRKRKKKKK